MNEEERQRIRTIVADIASMPEHISRRTSAEVRLITEAPGGFLLRGFIVSRDEVAFRMELTNGQQAPIVYGNVAVVMLSPRLPRIRRVGGVGVRPLR